MLYSHLVSYYKVLKGAFVTAGYCLMSFLSKIPHSESFSAVNTSVVLNFHPVPLKKNTNSSKLKQFWLILDSTQWIIIVLNVINTFQSKPLYRLNTNTKKSSVWYKICLNFTGRVFTYLWHISGLLIVPLTSSSPGTSVGPALPPASRMLPPGHPCRTSQIWSTPASLLIS